MEISKIVNSFINKKLLGLLFAIFAANLIVWGLLIFRISSFKKQPIFERVELPTFSLKDLEGNKINSKNLNARLNVLIFFSFEDCPLCLFEAEFWGKAAQVFPKRGIKFIGITWEREKGKLSRFCQQYNLRFPILYDENGRLKNRISSILYSSKNKSITPFKIFVSRHKIIGYEGPTKNYDEQKNFPLRILSLLNKIQ